MTKSTWRTYISCALYTLLVPLGFIAGAEFVMTNYLWFGTILGVSMTTEFCAGVLWMKAYKVEMENARHKKKVHK